MPRPTPYQRQYSATAWSQDYPSSPQPGVQLDAEFNAIAKTLGETLRNLSLLQRDDGALNNGLVTLDALSPGALSALKSGSWAVRGVWGSGQGYSVGDVVVSGTVTAVCAVAHAAGVFATDLAAGRWVLLFDTSVTTPPAGSIQTAMLADGAVTPTKLGFASLGLSGSFRAGGGLAAGTAPQGALMHARLDAGNVYARVERIAADQGEVGYQILGVNATWTLFLEPNGADLVFETSAGDVARLRANGTMDTLGAFRATGGAVPSAGAGAEVAYASGTALFRAFDRSAGEWRPAWLQGQTAGLTAGGVNVLTATSTVVNIAANVALQLNGVDVGYLDVPQNVQSGAYSLVMADRGKHIFSANLAGQVVTVPANSTVAFPIGTVVTLVNSGTNPMTISPAVGVTLRRPGTALTGARTLATPGMATLLKVGTNTWFVTGAGLS